MDPALVGIVVVLVVSAGGLVLALSRGDPKFRRPPEAPTPPLDVSHPLVQQLGEELRALDAMSITSKKERAIWYVSAAALEKKLRYEYAEISDSLPHEIYHYLADADIRAKEPEYAERQKAELALFLVR